MKGLFLILFAGIAFQIGRCNENKESGPTPIPFAQLDVRGELLSRITKNYVRLEEPRYQPQFVFLSDEESNNWPGDTEGRTILGLVMAAQSTHREPLYLKEIIDQLPRHFNEKGYMGKIHPAGIMDEQQLAGNGWVMRGLCEYYAWKKDESVLKLVKSISDHLFIPGKGYYQKYPIEPGSRKHDGGMIGHINEVRDGWRITADIGCVFIGMTGAIHAYQYLKDEKLKQVIDEMVAKFLQVDMYGLKIQVHAGLTALLGLVRYAKITGNDQLMKEVEKRWDLYVKYGMTENYEIYNWFGMYKQWTESCGLIDSYLLASDLWQYTRNPKFLEYMDLIYYNALCHLERANGGFGCDNNPGASTNFLNVYADEAWWCCTMRAGEGLSRVAETSYFTQADTIYTVHYGDNTANFNFGQNSSITLHQTTQYPFEGKIRIVINQAVNSDHVIIKLNSLNTWADNQMVSINGKPVVAKNRNGFIEISHPWKKNDTINYSFNEKLRTHGCINTENCSNSQKKIFYGPLILGYSGKDSIANVDISGLKKLPGKLSNKYSREMIPELLIFKIDGTNEYLSPLYHFMNPEVRKGDYKKQFLFHLRE